MNNLIDAPLQTPIEIALGIDENGRTTAKKLYTFLELDRSHYTRWCSSNIVENEFATENEDYFVFAIDGENPLGGRPTQDYKLSARFAKKLSMKGNGAKAEEAREYFTLVEEKAKEIVVNRSNLSAQMQMFYMIADGQAKLELDNQRISKDVEEVKQRQKVIADTFKKQSDVENFKKWCRDSILTIASSPQYVHGINLRQRIGSAWNESYRRLTEKRGCNLDDRVERAKRRAMEENPGIKKDKLNEINKLYVICEDRNLKPAYELVIKEMIACYCIE